MTHDAVWFSRPRKFGKGSRQWYAQPANHIASMASLSILAGSVPTKRVSSANMDLICVVSASEKSRQPLGSPRCASTLCISFLNRFIRISLEPVKVSVHTTSAAILLLLVFNPSHSSENLKWYMLNQLIPLDVLDGQVQIQLVV